MDRLREIAAIPRRAAITRAEVEKNIFFKKRSAAWEGVGCVVCGTLVILIAVHFILFGG